MPKMVEDLVDQFKKIWWDCETSLPSLGPVYTKKEQSLREVDFERRIDDLLGELKNLPRKEFNHPAFRQRLQSTWIYLAKSALGLEERHIDAILSFDFIHILAEFARGARQVDPTIRPEDIFQASRNVMSMNFLQVLMGISVELTPAIFAYSMLYPLTDNYLDDPAIPLEIKVAFNSRFRRRLVGETVTPANPREQAICDMVGMIEGQFDRSIFPQVYDSLLTIHVAQAKSLALLRRCSSERRNTSPYEVDVLGLCFEKGGTAVLADGYLVAGKLNQAQREFMFYYGTFTQLMDDLEDVQQDLKKNISSIFSQTALHWPLDSITNRTIHLGSRVLDALETFNEPTSCPVKEILHKSITPLLIVSAGSAPHLYTRPYLQELQTHLPIRFSFLDRQRKKLAHRQISFSSLVDMF